MSQSAPVAPSRLSLCPTREDLPADPPAGTYVVVDVMYFSTTVVELLANDAACVHIPLAGSDPAAFKRTNPEALVGGEGTGQEPYAHHDFFNCPSFVQSLDLVGQQTSMMSFNGGRTVADLRAADDATVYVASSTNAGAVGRKLRGASGPITLVGAGCDGDVAPEDILGAMLVARHATGQPMTEKLRDAYADRLRSLRGPLEALEAHRRRDITEFVTALDSRRVVPELDGDRLVDTADHVLGQHQRALAGN